MVTTSSCAPAGLKMLTFIQNSEIFCEMYTMWGVYELVIKSKIKWSRFADPQTPWCPR